MKIKKLEPPPRSYYKINVDAALDLRNKNSDMGVVVRNNDGEVIGMATNGRSSDGDVECAETTAVQSRI